MGSKNSTDSVSFASDIVYRLKSGLRRIARSITVSAERIARRPLSKATKKKIAMMGFNPEYGARPILGIIRKELRRPMSKMIISGKLKSGDTIEVKMEEGQVAFYVNGNKTEYLMK